jgi:hypothetical protein
VHVSSLAGQEADLLCLGFSEQVSPESSMISSGCICDVFPGSCRAGGVIGTLQKRETSCGSVYNMLETRDCFVCFRYLFPDYFPVAPNRYSKHELNISLMEET